MGVNTQTQKKGVYKLIGSNKFLKKKFAPCLSEKEEGRIIAIQVHFYG
jgi:hypothetical protein